MRLSRAGRRHLLAVFGGILAAGSIFVLLELSTELWRNPELGRKADDLLWRYNVATGSTALIFLVMTMSIGPIRVLRGKRRSPANIPWRRVLGIWSAVFALFHFPGGLAIHSTGWEVWDPFLRIIPEPGNLVDGFGISFWAGLLALLSLAILAVTSRDAALRHMGAVRWKRLHRLAYVGLGLVIVHAIGMQYSEGRDLRQVALTATLLAAAVGFQVAGLLVRRSREKAVSGSDGVSD